MREFVKMFANRRGLYNSLSWHAPADEWVFRQFDSSLNVVKNNKHMAIKYFTNGGKI